ncbi:hypothetical protein E5288_WYG017109 [Bos mutus]|uniref:C2H2-type domain-containing protein n=1 Tax=Bos mutus TaxID=72004 RepID=A0A6B0RE33_9CETA|nr:hypothetical protein [Bos mutus]
MLDAPMDFTTEDQVYWSGNSEEAYLEAIEELEEFLQKLDETHGTRSPAAPEAKPDVPPTAHEEDRRNESVQNEVMDLLTHNDYLRMFEHPRDTFSAELTSTHVKALDLPPGNDPTIEDVVQVSGNSKEVSRYSYLQTVEEIKAFLREANETRKARTPAAPEPEFCVPPTAREADDQKESMQRQKPTTEDLVQLSGTSKEASMTSFFVTLEDIEEFLHEINEIHEAKTPPAPESEVCAPLTAHYEDSQMESMKNQVTSFDDRNPTGASQLMDVTDTPMTFITDCQVTVVNANKRTISNEGSKVKTLNDDQSLCGGQMTISGDQTLYGGQMKSPTVCQNLNGTQMTFTADKTIYGNQMKTIDEDQILSVGQMNFSGDQTLYGGQMKTVNDDTLHGVHITPQSLSSLSYPRILYVASSHLIQGQPVEMQKWNPKIQRCPLQKRPDILRPYICTYKNCGKAYAKSSHLRIHERVHTGEKPYKCNVNGCTWAFSRSDELNRHKKRHTRERPYLCTICDKAFARSDHLKQHQRVHR